METNIYQVKEFPLENLKGISNQTLEAHFKLYKDYVTHTNELNERIFALLKNKEIPDDKLTVYSELKRRFGFEYNGMILHEFYFENLKTNNEDLPKENSLFLESIEKTFGDFETWKLDFTTTGKMRGVGWAICYQNPIQGTLSNHWINLHETGNISMFNPILVMDVWEHAFLLDYEITERAQYIDAFFSNVNWSTVESRMSTKEGR